VTGASACKVYDHADVLVPRRCMKEGAVLGPNSWKVKDRPNLLVPRWCVRAGTRSGPNSNMLLSLSIVLAFFTLPPSLSDSVSKLLLVKLTILFLAGGLGSKKAILSKSEPLSILIFGLWSNGGSALARLFCGDKSNCVETISKFES
jgi:hypothetical protein